jgi:adenylosuccinate synthase
MFIQRSTKEKALAEGARGKHADIDFGTFPFANLI